MALSLPAAGYFRPASRYRRFAVAADNVDASRAGYEVLRGGGNAVDAAVATVLALGVTSPSSSGFGGGGFATVCTPQGECTFVDFRETAPAAITLELLHNAPDPAHASKVGALAVGVPGEPAGLLHLSRRFGRAPFARLVAPAVRLAGAGFAVSPWLSARVGENARNLAGDPLLSRIWTPSGTPVAAHARVTRPLLAAALRRYGAEGDRFVRGPLATAIEATMRSGHGAMTARDVIDYAPRERAPLRVTFRDHTVVTAPYPSAGGLLVAETLALVGDTPVDTAPPGSSAWDHLLTESWRGAFDDRARYVGDPENAGVVPPASLLDAARMARRRARIDPAHATPVAVDEPAHDHGTTHLCVVDADGMMVSLTTTVNDPFGARITVPTMDIVLNDEIDDFSLGAGSSYGLAASRPNALTPGRRPVSSMSPTIVLANGRPVGCVGASGGPRIATTTAQVLLNLLRHGMDPESAVSAPRIHHQGAPDELRVEREVPEDVRAALRARGHTVVQTDALAVSQVIWVQGEGASRAVLAASDPRKDGLPAGE